MKLNTTKTKRLGCVGYAGRRVLWGWVLMVTVVSSSLAATATLTVTAPVQDPTCDISIPQAGGAGGGPGTPLMLGRFMADDFSMHGGTAATAAFQIKVDGCSGLTSATPALKVSGGTLSGNAHVFNADPNGATGYMIRAEKFTGALSQFYSTTALTVVENGKDSYDGSASLVKDGVLDYTVGFVAPELASGGTGLAPGDGDVNASVTFEFHYH